MHTFKKFFLLPSIITLICCLLILFFNGVGALLSVLILIVLEVSLSFDNAVVNAKVLEKMDDKWKRRFINWGIWVAVFGTRVVLPIFIVAAVSGISIVKVLNLAIFDPAAYGIQLDNAHYSVGAFGGTFLLLVALKYFIDDHKEIHWIKILEKRLKKFSSVESVEVVLAFLLLLFISYLVPVHALEILVAGIIGVITFVLLESITSNMGETFDKNLGAVAVSGFTLFMYLNILDVAFSLDGVIGAFAISTNLLIIAVGLGVGAYFVRSFTLMMVERKTLSELQYLEHGAHWAIFGLGICMLLGLVVHISEIFTGIIGLILILTAYFSSIKK